MSRILQALKQLEARPGEAPAPSLPPASLPPPVALNDAPSAAPTLPLAPLEPAPAIQRQVTERIQPRRKPRKARRVKAELPPVENLAVQTAEDIERLLSALMPGVIECWTPHESIASVVVPAQPEFITTPVQAHVVLQDFTNLPAAVSPATSHPASEVELEVRAIHPPASSSEVELEVNLAPTPAPATEVELAFTTILPRRASQPAVTVTRSPVERAETQAIEQQVRQVVRGPRSESVTRASAWETTIQADLDNAAVVAPIQSLIERWQADRGTNKTSTLLVASLAEPNCAGEVALRAAALLARTTDEAVLVIDGDPQGALSRRLAIIGKPGLTELLTPQDAHGETIFPTATARLHVLPRGRAAWPATPPTAALQQLLTDLAQEYAWLIVVVGEADSPPMATLARACAGTYVVAPLGETSVAEAEQRLAALQTAGARILGAIATQ